MTLTVGIAGITGRFGRRLAAHLLQRPAVTVHGYCRSPQKVDAALLNQHQSRLQLFAGEADDASAVAAFVQPCDVVVCAYLGDNALMFDAQKLLVDACDVARVPRYVAGDWSLDYTRLQLGELPPKDPMIRVKAHLETKEHVKGLHVLNGAFMEVLFSPFFGALDVPARKMRYWGSGDEVLESTTYDTAAAYTAAMIVDPLAVGIKKGELEAILYFLM